MEKNKIFSKFNIKNYNNELEKILDEKLFSLNVKNLLLSMFYKIESAYKDYETIKVETLSKNDYIDHLLKTIKEKCFDIEFINPEENRKIEIDQKKGKIFCYPNEKSLLSAIWYIGEEKKKIDLEYEYTEKSIRKMATIGENISQVEVIRDFNGWSWDIGIKEIEDIKYNILYQSLLLLYGNKLIETNMNDEEENNISICKGNKETNNFEALLGEISVDMYIRKDEEELNNIISIKTEKEEQLKSFLNKKEFVQKITNEKKKLSGEIERIDRIINNTDLLKKEYRERNENLPNKEKIFSISHLADILEDERNQKLERMQKFNKMLDPKGFVKEKDKIQSEIEFLNGISIDDYDENEENNKIIKYCNEFLKCAERQIKDVQEKSDIINWIYKIRYYRYIPYDENIYLKDIKELDNQFEKIIKLLTKKAQENKVWDIFTENEELTNIVIKQLFNSKIINLENLNILCKYENEILYLEYCDGDTLEMKSEIKLRNVRIKKKIKLFI